MACIKLHSQWGDRLVPENIPYQRLEGEEIVGVAWDCGNQVTQDEVDANLERAGLKLGDAIAWVTHKMGIQQCAPCKARQEILNNVSKVGWAATLKQIKDTF